MSSSIQQGNKLKRSFEQGIAKRSARKELGSVKSECQTRFIVPRTAQDTPMDEALTFNNIITLLLGLRKWPPLDLTTLNWQQIVASLPPKKLGQKSCNRSLAKKSHHNDSKCSGPWSPEEDERLCRYMHLSRESMEKEDNVTSKKVSWVKAAAAVGTRTADQAAKRWKATLDPSISHSPFTEAEDRLIMNGVTTYGTSWGTVIQQCGLQNRSGLQIKNRWDHLSRLIIAAVDAEADAKREPGIAKEGNVNKAGTKSNTHRKCHRQYSTRSVSTLSDTQEQRNRKRCRPNTVTYNRREEISDVPERDLSNCPASTDIGGSHPPVNFNNVCSSNGSQVDAFVSTTWDKIPKQCQNSSLLMDQEIKSVTSRDVFSQSNSMQEVDELSCSPKRKKERLASCPSSLSGNRDDHHLLQSFISENSNFFSSSITPITFGDPDIPLMGLSSGQEPIPLTMEFGWNYDTHEFAADEHEITLTSEVQPWPCYTSSKHNTCNTEPSNILGLLSPTTSFSYHQDLVGDDQHNYDTSMLKPEILKSDIIQENCTPH